MRILATAVILLTAPVPAMAADAPAGSPAPQVKEKKICRPLPARTGSHRPQGRVCKTAAEWKIRDRDQYIQAPIEDATKVEVSGPKIG
jgi:hypothetical protein